MKKLLFALILVVSSSAAMAGFNSWELTEVRDTNHVPVGYVYSINSTGTASFGDKTTKSITSLRLICSLKGGNPIFAIYWNKRIGPNTLVPTVTVDGTQPVLDEPTVWVRDGGKLVYRDLYKSQNLLKAAKTGKELSFEIRDDMSVFYKTTFLLSGFDYTDFNTKCKTQL